MHARWRARPRRTFHQHGSSVFRTIKMSFEAVEWIQGMKSYRFVADRKMLAGPAENPDNWCFCKDGNVTECSPSGTCDISRCRYGAPAFISYPHFYLGDETLLEAVGGLMPDPKKHKMTLTIEPVQRMFATFVCFVPSRRVKEVSSASGLI